MTEYKVVPVELTKEMLDSDPYGMGYGRIHAVYHRLLSASPETEMVAVPRELLERIVNTNMADYSVIVYQHKEIRTFLEKAND